jgi:hypothetical protein
MTGGIGKAEETPNRVKLQFTRHARNRMRLYGITSEDMEEVYRAPLSGPETKGTRTVLLGKPQARFADRLLKVIYIEEQGNHVVLSMYPSKRAHRRPDHEGPV